MAGGPDGFKVCLLGEGRVGKTSLVGKFVQGSFDDQQPSTKDASYTSRDVRAGGKTHRVKIWDTAGQEQFHALAPIYYRDADGALIVYDITNQASLDRARRWADELKTMAPANICIAIAGNKVDLQKERTVSQEAAMSLAKEIGAVHFHTSAKSGEGVEEVFAALAGNIDKKRVEAPAGVAGGGGGGYGTGGRAGGGPAGRARPGKRTRILLDDDDDEAAGKQSGGGCCK